MKAIVFDVDDTLSFNGQREQFATDFTGVKEDANGKRNQRWHDMFQDGRLFHLDEPIPRARYTYTLLYSASIHEKADHKGEHDACKFCFDHGRIILEEISDDYREILNAGALEVRREMVPFYLDRDEDESGVSGTGRVAVGVYFQHDGIAILHWLRCGYSTGFYGPTTQDPRDGMEKLEDIHGHDGKTKVVMGYPGTPGEIEELRDNCSVAYAAIVNFLAKLEHAPGDLDDEIAHLREAIELDHWREA